jgi:hypothetical protein
MTRARALKQAIRARAGRTGERYTTARRFVLLERHAAGTGKPEGLPPPAPGKPEGLPPPATKVSSKGAISDAAVVKKTGRDLAYWYGVLDRFGAVEKGHTAAARHLYEEHGVPGWYTQGITVSYERARGVRAVNQRCDGGFEVSASKVIAADAKRLVKAFTDARQRARWTKGMDAAMTSALVSGLADRKSKGWVVRPDGMARFRYKWDGTTVQLYAYPKAGGKLNVTVQHTGLPGGDAVESYRGQWKAMLGALAAQFTA